MDLRSVSSYWDRMRWLDGPPGRVFHSLWLLCLLILLLDASVPAGGGFTLLLVAIPLFVLGAVWCLRVLVFAVRRRSASRETRRQRGWLYAPISLLVVVLLASTSWPLRVRFSLSRPMLTSVADEVAAGGDGESSFVGLYLIDGVERFGTAVIFTEQTGGFLFDRGGFAYVPDDPNDPVLDGIAPRCVMWLLEDDWYAWHGSWFGGSALQGCGLDGPSLP